MLNRTSPHPGAFLRLDDQYTPQEIQERPELRKSRVIATSQATILRLLVDAPHSVKELEEETGVSRQTLTNYITHLRKKKLVHIEAWITVEGSTKPSACYRFAPDKRDVKRPKAMTATEKSRRYRANKKMKLASSVLIKLGTKC